MTKIQNFKLLHYADLFTALQYFVLVIRYWNLGFVCYLKIGIWCFACDAPEQIFSGIRFSVYRGA